ncbi:MAG TPA: acyl-CoA dehydrogenase family protein [Mycobacteriales bacterium]|nr:acyl-CoA dehydrogenase family protein [Mycobacteriales bacterium]
MYFGLPEDALALREGLRELLTAACTPATIRAAWDGDGCDDLWKQLGAFGVLGVLVDEARGGLGLDELSFVAALEEAGYAGVPGPLVETTAYLPEHDLPLDGSVRIAVQRVGALRVPNAGVATHVHREDDGALLDDFTALPFESVDRSRAVGSIVAPSGEAYSSHLSITWDDQPQAGSRAAARATLGTAAFLCGLARRQTDLTVAYLKERKQFGVVIGTYQGLKHPLASAVVDAEFAWPAVLRAAQSLATDDPAAAAHVSTAKALASDAAYRLSRVCLQAHGAMGYTVEYDLHLFMKRTWALAKDWGTSSQHRELIATELGL